MLVTAQSRERAFDLGFNLPQATLKPNTAEQIAVVTITSTQRLQLRWLTVHFVRLLTTGGALPVKVNPSLGSVYAGLYGDRAEFLTAPAGRPLVYVPVELPGVVPVSPNFIADVTPGTYTLLLVNNLQRNKVEVVAGGSFRLTMPS
jgi:hypothetical protein